VGVANFFLDQSIGIDDSSTKEGSLNLRVLYLKLNI